MKKILLFGGLAVVIAVGVALTMSAQFTQAQAQPYMGYKITKMYGAAKTANIGEGQLIWVVFNVNNETINGLGRTITSNVSSDDFGNLSGSADMRFDNTFESIGSLVFGKNFANHCGGAQCNEAKFDTTNQSLSGYAYSENTGGFINLSGVTFNIITGGSNRIRFSGTTQNAERGGVGGINFSDTLPIDGITADTVAVTPPQPPAQPVGPTVATRSAVSTATRSITATGDVSSIGGVGGTNTKITVVGFSYTDKNGITALTKQNNPLLIHNFSLSTEGPHVLLGSKYSVRAFAENDKAKDVYGVPIRNYSTFDAKAITQANPPTVVTKSAVVSSAKTPNFASLINTVLAQNSAQNSVTLTGNVSDIGGDADWTTIKYRGFNYYKLKTDGTIDGTIQTVLALQTSNSFSVVLKNLAAGDYKYYAFATNLLSDTDPSALPLIIEKTGPEIPIWQSFTISKSKDIPPLLPFSITGSRTPLAIREKVDLNVSDYKTDWSATAGIFSKASTNTNQSTTYTAPDTTQSVVITAIENTTEVSKKTDSKTVAVITPYALSCNTINASSINVSWAKQYTEANYAQHALTLFYSSGGPWATAAAIPSVGSNSQTLTGLYSDADYTFKLETKYGDNFAMDVSKLCTTPNIIVDTSCPTGTTRCSDNVCRANCGGTTFIPTITAPAVTTGGATNIGETIATANGTITGTGGENATVRGFEYGLTAMYGNTVSEPGSFGTGAFNKPLTGLSPGTIYHVRAFATNQTGQTGGTGYGFDQQFTTQSPLPQDNHSGISQTVAPTVTTQAPTGITGGGATANGTITATGGENASVRGFKYGTTETDMWTTPVENGAFGIGAFVGSLTGLTPGVTYHVRAFATNFAGGTGYGQYVAFTTPPGEFSITEPYGDLAILEQFKTKVSSGLGADWSITCPPGGTCGSITPESTDTYGEATYTAPQVNQNNITVKAMKKDNSKVSDSFTFSALDPYYPPTCVPKNQNTIDVNWTKRYTDMSYTTYAPHTLALLYKEGASGVWTKINSPSPSSGLYTHVGLKSGVDYYYKLDAAYSSPAPQFTKEIENTQPCRTAQTTNETPSNLKAFANSDKVVYLNWKDNSTRPAGSYTFEIQRFGLDMAQSTGLTATSTGSNSTKLVWQNSTTKPFTGQFARSTDQNFSTVKTVEDNTQQNGPMASPTYSLDQGNGLDEVTTYWYKARACSSLPIPDIYTKKGATDAHMDLSAGKPNPPCGPYTTSVKTTTWPNAPSGVQAVQVTDKSIKLSWTDNSKKETGYEVVRDGAVIKTLESSATIKGTVGNTIEYTDAGLNAGTTYAYTVRAYYNIPGGQSKLYSNQIAVNQKTDYIVSVTRGGDGQGTVTSDIPGVSGDKINCGPNPGETTCTGIVFKNDQTVTLTATQAQGDYVFAGWGGSCQNISGAKGEKCTLSGNADITANFALKYYRVYARYDGGKGLIASNDLSCASGVCSGIIERGQTVQFTASPNVNYILSSWISTDPSGQIAPSPCNGISNLTCSFQVTRDADTTANFASSVSTLTVTIQPAGSNGNRVTGTATGGGSGSINCVDSMSPCAISLTTDTIMRLSAQPVTGYSFTHWGTGECFGSTSPVCDTAQIVGSRQATAVFTKTTASALNSNQVSFSLPSVGAFFSQISEGIRISVPERNTNFASAYNAAFNSSSQKIIAPLNVYSTISDALNGASEFMMNLFTAHGQSSIQESYFTSIKSGLADSFYNDMGLTANAVYVYRVRLCSGGTCTPWSNMVATKTLDSAGIISNSTARPICKPSFCDFSITQSYNGANEKSEQQCQINADCRDVGRADQTFRER
ncbi:MAG: fibronectin type III domain-containing protein [Candidatus Jorgensenbacteria bacterium]|nr:fibronectin type III domain-containing protein [Candidatus Jorgensenbacteria bacterium]